MPQLMTCAVQLLSNKISHAPSTLKIFNQLNFPLLKAQSLRSCAHYFQWFTGYDVNHADFTHVIKNMF